mmetsp:Transcript_24371/g.57904  ORF Transcript_24371/g.57904 Transcript_24371/m.57904 type:complete len:245 (-) Transcript_24371:470-1204(-)
MPSQRARTPLHLEDRPAVADRDLRLERVVGQRKEQQPRGAGESGEPGGRRFAGEGAQVQGVAVGAGEGGAAFGVLLELVAHVDVPNLAGSILGHRRSAVGWPREHAGGGAAEGDAVYGRRVTLRAAPSAPPRQFHGLPHNLVLAVLVTNLPQLGVALHGSDGDEARVRGDGAGVRLERAGADHAKALPLARKHVNVVLGIIGARYHKAAIVRPLHPDQRPLVPRLELRNSAVLCILHRVDLHFF